jgi:hypothetical protein
MGAFLIAAPIVSDYLQRAQILEALISTGGSQVTLGESLSEAYRFGCWLIGALMICAAFLGTREKRP